MRLLADRLHLDERAVAQELAKATSRGAAVPRATSTDRSGRPARDGAASTSARAATHTVANGPEQVLTALVLDDPSRCQTLQQRLSLDEVTDPILRRILSILYEEAAAGRFTTPAHVVSRLTEEGQGGVVTALVALAQTVSAKERSFEECVHRLRTRTRTQELALLREHIQAAQRAGDHEALQQLLVEYQQRLDESARASRQRAIAAAGSTDVPIASQELMATL